MIFTGHLDADLSAVQDAGVQRADVDAFLRHHAEWVRRLALSRWRKFERAHAVVDVADAENVVRLAVWSALVAYRFICPHAYCMRDGVRWSCARRAQWNAHQRRHHRGELRRAPANSIAKYVLLTALNAVKDECRVHYKAKRIAARHADEAVRPEVLDFSRRMVRTRSSGEDADPSVDLASCDAPDLGLQLAEMAAEARAHLAPAANRMLATLLDGGDPAEAAALERSIPPETARATARRAQGFLRAFAEKTWGSR